jgi:hypothetical protein
MGYPAPLESTRYSVNLMQLYESIDRDMLRGKIEPGLRSDLVPVMDILDRYVKGRQGRGKSVISPTTSKSESGALAKTFAKVLKEACTEDELKRINVPVYGKMTRQMKYFRTFLDEAEVQLFNQESKTYRPFIRTGKEKIIDADAKAIATWLADYYCARDIADYRSLPKAQKVARAGEFYTRHGVDAAVPSDGKPPAKAAMKEALVGKLLGSHDHDGLKAIYWSIVEKENQVAEQEKLAEGIRKNGLQLDLFS